MKKALILANGDSPKIRQIRYLQKIGYKKLICADGGANSAKKLNIIPDLIIGDLDSISGETLKYYADKSKIIKLKRQNDTDVEKAIKYLIKNKFDEVILLGATGDRLDHSICNLGIVLKFFHQIRISILHEKSFLRAYDSYIKLSTIKNEIISIYGFSEITKIISRGLKYQLKNISLPFGQKESTSNMAKGKIVELTITNGTIFVIREFKILKDNDLI